MKAIFFDPVTQGVTRQAKQLRRAGYVSVGTAQGLTDELAFDLVQVDAG